MTTFIHTADWQLGKPFARIEDVSKRSRVQQERLDVLRRIAAAVQKYQAQFVVVAGDVFDSPSVTRDIVSQACGLIGTMKVPVFVIPGNHDHAGPGSVWEQDFFCRERESLAPNLTVLLKPMHELSEQALLFPCPLLRRHESADPTAWLRTIDESQLNKLSDQPRIVLAHGSVQGFGSQDDEDDMLTGTNQIDLSRLPPGMFDYVALGDWHGTKKINENAWYSGTPERDRFPKGDSNEPGHILVVRSERGFTPEVECVPTSRLHWHELSFQFVDDVDVVHFQQRLQELLGSRTGEDLLRLNLSGSLGFAARANLETILESLRARLLRVRMSDNVLLAPTAEELDTLTRRTSDPVTSRVAQALLELARQESAEAEIARLALRELHSACQSV